MEDNKPNLKEDEKYCFKCKKIVHISEYNHYYKICNKCVQNSGR